MADGADELIERFLATGRVPPGFRGWPGEAASRRAEATSTLQNILCRIVAWRARRAPLRLGAPPVDVAGRVRDRTRRAVEGLFDPPDAAQVLAELPARVRVVTAASYPTLVDALPLDRAWDLANLLLDHMGAPTLSDDVPRLDALCCGGTAYLIPAAFTPRPDADVVLHECVHVLLDSRRGPFGLAPADLPLLAVPVAHHETAAYAVEAWACAERAPGLDPATWGRLAAEDARVDRAALSDLLERARRESWAGLRAGLAALR